MRRLIVASLLVSLPLASWACMNDRDSDALVVQNKRLPDALRVITGRFERNPPRFYEMRVARVQQELKANPRAFGLYDDLAVAHDRLGDNATAMRVMAQKRALLPTFNAKDKANKEAWYRFYANNGSFRAHRFLHEGAKVERIAEMKQARAEIARAIQIKPDAHFGREKYQLAVMDWIIGTKTGKMSDSLGDWMQERFDWADDYEYKRMPLSPKRKDAAEGLSGLIVLGAAWQSPDVFDALATSLQARAAIGLSRLARQRSQELLQNGASSLRPQLLKNQGVEYHDDMDGWKHGLNPKNAQALDRSYPLLRAEADEWIRQRDQWMEAKFAQGQHPDTHPNFWSGWKEPKAEQLDKVHWWNEQQGRFEDEPKRASLWLLTPIFGSLGLALWILKRKWRAKSRNSFA